MPGRSGQRGADDPVDRAVERPAERHRPDQRAEDRQRTADSASLPKLAHEKSDGTAFGTEAGEASVMPTILPTPGRLRAPPPVKHSPRTDRCLPKGTTCRPLHPRLNSPSSPAHSAWRRSTGTGRATTSSSAPRRSRRSSRPSASTPPTTLPSRDPLPLLHDRAWRRTLPPIVVCREGQAAWVPVHLPDGATPEVWVGSRGWNDPPGARSGRPLPRAPGHRRPADGGGNLRGAGRPAARLAHGQRTDRSRQLLDPAGRGAVGSGPAARAAAATRLGLDEPDVLRPVPSVVGSWGPRRPRRHGGLGGAGPARGLRPGEPAARGRAGGRRWSPRPICRRPGGSSTRSTSGSRTSRRCGYLSSAERQLLEWHADDARTLNEQDSHRPRRGLVGQGRGAAHRLPSAAVSATRAGLRRVLRARGPGAARLRHVVRAGREARAAVGPVARRPAGPTQLRGRDVARADRRRRGVPPLVAVDRRRAARRRPAARPGGRDVAWGHARPRGRRASRAAPTPGGLPRPSRAGSPSAPRRTRTTSWARTGASRRGGRTGSRSSATRRTGTCCAPCCAMPVASGSTTSSGCSGCGGSPRAGPPARAPTCATTTRR